MKRQIIHIDEDLCDGCGECVAACAEGAIAIVEGKARLVSESYCDGLGACLGDCPQGALTVVEREADAFDEQAVADHLAREDGRAPPCPPPVAAGGCPGSAARALRPVPAAPSAGSPEGAPSRLANWPVQLKLAPFEAPYYDGATLLVAADCVPFAYRAFHDDLLAGRALLVGCPKLDDVELYWRKLAEILRRNDIVAVEVAFMEVPCCNGLVRLVEAAVEASGKRVPIGHVRVGIHGELLERLAPAAAGCPALSLAQGGQP